MKLLLLIATCVVGGSAGVVSQKNPVVQIRNGTLVGVSAAGIDNFFGIPYTKPPVDGLRLQVPQTIDQRYGTLKLPTDNKQVRACPQMHLSPLNLTAVTTIPVDQQAGYYGPNGNEVDVLQGEDCLTVNIQRPANTPTGKKLPVVFWIYGGGYETGSTQLYDGSRFVNLSISMNEPVIYVAANYRLNAFGFLQGKQLQAEGLTNLGLRDQRKALEWVAENIASFGGDPDRVTLWGESAGALSVFDHLIVHNGNNMYNGKPLFHAAILNSGSFIHTQAANSPKAQAVFDQVATYAGCPPASFNDSSAIVPCLRSVSYNVYKAAMNLLPDFATSRSNDGVYTHRPDPSSDFYSQYAEDAIRTGQYARVPVIMGNLQDEATVFAPGQIGLINDTASLVSYFNSWLTETPRALVQGLIDTYSTDPADGLPVGTGAQFEIYPQSKRNAAVQTDMVFAVGRRISLSYMAPHIPAWSFLGTFQHGLPWWGTHHIADLEPEFGMDVDRYAGQKMDESYIHFANYQNPNGKPGACVEWWPKWDNQGLQLANFSANAVGLTKDNFRQESYEYWRKYGSQMRQ